MSFPNQLIVDDTTRSDENPLSNGGFWETVVNAKLASNRIVSVTSGVWYFISPVCSSADEEVYTTLAVLPGTGQDVYLYLRYSSTDHYYMILDNYAGDNTFAQLYINKFTTPGGSTTLLQVNNVSFSAGDQIGFSVAGSTLTAYVNGTSVGTVDDTSPLTAAGKIAVLGFDDVTAFTSIGGGPFAGGPTNFPVSMGSGTYAITGTALTITYVPLESGDHPVTLEAGSYGITGEDLGIEHAVPFDTGVYNITGTNIGITWTAAGGTPHSLALGTGSYDIVGKFLGIGASKYLEPGSYEITGQDLTIARTNMPHAVLESGSYLIVGSSGADRMRIMLNGVEFGDVLPVGVVPVYFVTVVNPVDNDNVVAVEVVTSPGPGVVSVREVSYHPNAVPVYIETDPLIPKTKVRKV